MEITIRVIDSLSPGFWRVIVGPGVGMMDGGSEQDWPEEWIPLAARCRNGEFQINDWVDGVPQSVEQD